LKGYILKKELNYSKMYKKVQLHIVLIMHILVYTIVIPFTDLTTQANIYYFIYYSYKINHILEAD